MPVIRIIRSLALGLHPFGPYFPWEARTNFRVEVIDIRMAALLEFSRPDNFSSRHLRCQPAIISLLLPWWP